MVFLHNDFYTTSGSVKLYNCWTDKVTKFDTSSFYNWEQDNLPVYDLEERTYLLWEKLGHPTSSLPGVVLVVSAGAAAANYACNTNIYENLCEAIAALPEVINYPIIIEVCNKGIMDDLTLRNIKFGCNGSLEIVNKNFAKVEPYRGTTAINCFSVITSENLKYGRLGYVSSLVYGVRQHLSETKSEFLNVPIYSSLTDVQNNELKLNGFFVPSPLDNYTPPSYGLGCSAIAANLGGLGNNTSGALGLFFYESTTEATTSINELINSYDISSIQRVLNENLIEKKSFPNEIAGLLSDFRAGIIGLFYGNVVKNIHISNCDGPIYVRNFFVDGSSTYSNNDYGILINNCENLVLENCASIRNTKAGIYVNNSNVTLTRGVGAYRNYTRPRVVQNVSSSYETDLAAGLLANNSNIYFSSTSAFEYYTASSDPVYGTLLSGTNKLAYGANYPINFNRNANGIVLINSKLHGGIPGSYPTQLLSDHNFFVGLKMINSELSWDGKLVLHSNDTGLLAENSVIKTDTQTVRFNQKNGVHLKNSTLTYNKNNNQTGLQYNYDRNGTHLVLENSNYSCEMVSSMPTKVGQHKFYNSHEIIHYNDLPRSVPSIKVTNSSKCVLTHPYIIRDASSIVNDSLFKYPKLGLAMKVQNNSNATIKGSENYANVVAGPANNDKQINSVGVYVSDESSFSVQGPTVIARFGIDILTDNNSVLNITPHQTEDNILQRQEFNLADTSNHTMVELHSTEACLVAHKNSTINIKNLGNYYINWTNSTEGISAIAGTPDLSAFAVLNGSSIQGGFLQFYPNPVDVTSNNNSVSVANDAFTNDYYLFNRQGAAFNTFSSVTLGGMCIRALENSIVNIQNVNFPCGWWNTSAPIFDAEFTTLANLCSRLFIWNIADNSQLHAAYCSVSSNFPQSVGYHGPRALWQQTFVAPITLSGPTLALAPSSTPDTSSLSIFDYFGSGPTSGTNSSIFFTSSFQNQGPFRLYFSVDPACYLLNLSGPTTAGYDSSGWLFQIYSQGYQPPFAASAIPNASAIHKSLLVGNFSAAETRGYYYGSSMLHAPSTQRVFLDESAANTFANAKHCSVGKSGLGKVVSIYYPYQTLFGGEALLNTFKDIGIGLYSINTFDMDRNN